MFTFIFVSAIGLVAAGFVKNLWPLVTGREVGLTLLEQRGYLLPFRAMALVLAAPLLLIDACMDELEQASDGLFSWWITLPAALGCAFVQGVVVVVTLASIG